MFFSLISHDLKSPFNALVGYSSILIDSYDVFSCEERLSFIERINKVSNNTLRLLDNLLSWSRSQMNVLTFTPKLENAKQLISCTVEMLLELSKEKSIVITMSIDTGLFVMIDQDMVETIIRNLVLNAIKFTPKNGSVNINAEHSTKQPGFIQIAIEDNGVGIADENKEKLFKGSENVSTKGTEEESGTGLGLILCKEFVEKHGGEIWFESSLGKGTTFFLTLPFAPDV
jgi:signal transduction histidine kinase